MRVFFGLGGLRAHVLWRNTAPKPVNQTSCRCICSFLYFNPRGGYVILWQYKIIFFVEVVAVRVGQGLKQGTLILEFAR